MKLLRQYRGFTLIELLIGTFIAGLLLLAVVTALTSSHNSFRVQKSYTVMQETGNFALDWLKKDVQNAAFNEPIVGLPEFPIIFSGDVKTSRDNNSGMANVPSDTLTVRYEVHNVDRDCGGSTINPGDWVVNSYQISSTGHLVCEGKDQTQEIIDNVDSFQVLYGLDTDTPTDLYPNVYVNAGDAVGNEYSIRAVRIALLVKSDSALESGLSRSYQLLNEAPVTFNDGHLRHVFVSTIPIRNTELLIE